MSIYDHFRPEEAVFVDKVKEWKEYAEHYHKIKLTDFLDPREQQIIKLVIGTHADVSVHFYGVASDAERKRALICPPYVKPDIQDFSMELLQVDYAVKFQEIEHRQVLGALMSLGLKREKFGDIILCEDVVQIISAKEIADYIIMNLESIGRAKVSVRSVPFKTIAAVQEEWKEKAGTLTSLRLDVLIAEMFNLSRQKVQLLVKGGLVKVNWKTIEQPSFECLEGDVLSVRGFGRSKLLSIEGKTKRDKWKVVYGTRK
ncbi:RNA-binding protein [Bacillus sp. 165]|uniref:YlmH family RNA-binding protein n=1 Tax=Bacillus sp. 165 TaxID=1529117 RepID=UPI001ADB6713|nr:RNA-binding protein [Bacillus sp. 165]MBO9130248.1 RNA-binding protein [Bacillus sp. 165]